MKNAILVATLIACTLSAPIVSAQEKAAQGGTSMNMDTNKQMPQMQESMMKMQQQMDKLQTTTDPKERQQLMQDHMQAMQENMKTMRGMGSPMVLESGQHNSMTMGAKRGRMTAADATKRADMMEKRMDMMQMMMEQMMKHDQAMEPLAAK